MDRLLIGFFIGALVFNTDPTIKAMGAVAEVVMTMLDVAEEGGRKIGDKAIEELRERDLVE